MIACRECRAIVGERAADPAVDPALWPEARTHLAECRACREAALAADPTLLFQFLPPVEIEDSEIADLGRAVATLARASEIGRRAPRRAPWIGRAAAAAAIATLALLAGAPAQRPGANPARTAGLAPLDAREATDAITAELASQPLVEDLDRPQARVYELPAEGLAVVMIVDSSLDL
ncbi:MAG: hypothetical protein U0X73_10390 [Thermoanaerobaculia bacterium]